MNSIFTRRSVRHYQDKPVSQEDLEKLLRAAMQAPSAHNQQPWEFLVLQEREMLDKLSHYNPYGTSLTRAPLAIVVLGNQERMTAPTRWEQDLGAATQNLLVEAVELGLGAVWLGVCPDEDRTTYIRNLLQLPPHIIPYAVLAIGHPSREGANRFVDRYDPTRVHVSQYHAET